MKLKLMNNNDLLVEATGKSLVRMAYPSQYAVGNYYQLTFDEYPQYVWVQLDASIKPTLMYVKDEWNYQIPFNIQREWPYPDGAFLGKNHYSWAKLATKEEIKMYQNLAINTYDQHVSTSAFPHVTANAETRNEMSFFAKNAIDGIAANNKHGGYPFQSWGIDQRDDAEFKLDFGREVEVDQLNILLRADYPHDISWKEMTIRFSDGSYEKINLHRDKNYQIFPITKRTVTWLKLVDLIKDEDSESFPALTQIEVMGSNIQEGQKNE